MLTAVALPGVLLADDQGTVGTRGAPNVAAVGLPADASTAGTSAVDPVVAAERNAVEPVYLSGTPPAAEPAPIEAAIGTTTDTLVSRVMATYARDVNGADVCWYSGIDGGQLITVRNPANGRSIECFTVYRDGDDPGLVALSTDAFALLADLTDAPVHVEIRQ